MARFDVVVSGGGIAGLTAAITFAKYDRNVLLLTSGQQASSKGKFGMDIRTVALSPVSVEFLRSLRLPADVPWSGIRKMHVWEAEGTTAIDFDVAELTIQALAYVFENRLLIEALTDVARGCVTIREDQIVALEIDHGSVSLRDGVSISTDLLVIAEGARSSTGEHLGLKRKEWQTNQHAIATLAQVSSNHANCAWQKFSPTPLALLPTTEKDICSVIWSVRNNQLNEIQALSETEFAARLTKETENVCGEVLKLDARLTFPVQQTLVADMYPTSRTLVIGDSARTVHPLAGQGINLGLEDVRAMEYVLRTNPKVLNEVGLWRRYATRRYVRSRMMLAMMSVFSKLWLAEGPYERLVRNKGIRSVVGNASIRKQIMREAIGVGPLSKVI